MLYALVIKEATFTDQYIKCITDKIAVSSIFALSIWDCKQRAARYTHDLGTPIFVTAISGNNFKKHVSSVRSAELALTHRAHR